MQYLFYLWTASMMAYVMTPADVLSSKLLPPMLIAVGIFSVLDGHPVIGASLASVGLTLGLFFRFRNNQNK